MTLIESGFAQRLGAAGGLGDDALEDFTRVIEAIVGPLDSHERNHFALELLDAVRAPGDEAFDKTLEAWWITAAIRQHPDYAWQKKEYDNLLSSGELHSSAAEAAGKLSA